MAKVMPDLKSSGQEKFFLFHASLGPFYPSMNPLISAVAALRYRIWGLAVWNSGPQVLLCFFNYSFRKGQHTELLHFQCCHLLHATHTIHIIIKHRFKVPPWVCYFLCPKLIACQSIWKPSSHMMERSICTKNKTKQYNTTCTFSCN